ncbi:hypothetical protein [Photobacterium damselae]|uniref:hypothetical protein n=1 Tax=Photobacterium damselae TaxID=38293 RepID=UPI0040693A12
MSIQTLSQQSLTPTNKKTAFYTLFALIATVVMFLPQFAHAVDMFAGAKTEIQESTNSDSTLWFSLTIAGLGVSALTGFLTKNWPLAIGGFFVGMIFLSAAATVIGLT